MVKLFKYSKYSPLCRLQLGGMWVMPNRIITRGPIIGELIVLIPVETGSKRVKALYFLRDSCTAIVPMATSFFLAGCFPLLFFDRLSNRLNLLKKSSDSTNRWRAGTVPRNCIFVLSTKLWSLASKDSDEVWDNWNHYKQVAFIRLQNTFNLNIIQNVHEMTFDFEILVTIFFIMRSGNAAWFLQCRFANR